MKNSITKAFIGSINDESISLAKDLSQFALDEAITDEMLKRIPILGTLVSIYKVGKTLKEAHTFKKIAVFLSRLSDVSEDDKEEFLNNLNSDDRYKESIFEKVLLLVERLDETTKAEMVGNLFRMYIMKVISKEKFLRLSSIVEKALLADLVVLHYRHRTYNYNESDYYKYQFSNETKISLFNLGLFNLKLDSKDAEYRAQHFGETGAVTPTITYEVNAQGGQLANLILYDLSNPAFQVVLAKMKSMSN